MRVSPPSPFGFGASFFSNAVSVKRQVQDIVLGLQSDYVDAMRTARAPYTVTRGGLDLVILPWTFPPYLDSELLAKSVRVAETEVLLDVGTGSGLVALVAAETSPRVVATDINPAAVETARLNADRLGLADRLTVHETDLFPPPEIGPFDVITFNPPYSDHTAADLAERSVWDPGHAAMKRFFGGLNAYLGPEGRLYITWADFADFQVLEDMIAAHGGRYFRVAEARDEISLFAVYEAAFDA